jgi:hypothetical protein
MRCPASAVAAADSSTAPIKTRRVGDEPTPHAQSVFNSLFHCSWSLHCRAIIPPCRQLSAVELRLRSSIVDDNACMYCGEHPNTMDHFRPVVHNGVPTGFGDDPWNYVPCCGTCNSSKGNRSWRQFMASASDRSPLGRGIPVARIKERMEACERFEREGRPQKWAVEKNMHSILHMRRTLAATMRHQAEQVTHVMRALGGHSTSSQTPRHTISVQLPRHSIGAATSAHHTTRFTSRRNKHKHGNHKTGATTHPAVLATHILPTTRDKRHTKVESVDTGKTRPQNLRSEIYAIAPWRWFSGGCVIRRTRTRNELRRRSRHIQCYGSM